MRHLDTLDLEDPKVKEWMDEHFKAGEYCILSIAVRTDDAAVLPMLQHLQSANLNMVLIPSMVIQVMINLKEVNALVEHLRKVNYNLVIPQNVQAMLDFADDKRGTVQ
jgi:hypothetical protein